MTEVLRDAYVLVVRADSPLAGRDRPPSLKEIAGERLIGYRDCRATAIVESQLRASGFEPEFVFRTDDNGVVQGLVAAGVGSAIVPRLAVDEANDAIRVIDLGTRLQPRRIGLAWHRDRYQTTAAEAFIETARAVCAELQERAQLAA